MRIAATITSKGQVTIPQEIRQRLGLKRGDRVEFIIQDGETVLRPARKSDNPFAAYAGALGSFASDSEVNVWLRELRDED